MKNKMRCLFDKITSKDLLGIFGICICALLIFTMLFSPLNANAYSYSEYPITLVFGNLGNVPYDTIFVNTYNGSLDDMGTITVSQPLTDANDLSAIVEFYTVGNQQYCRMDGIDIPLIYNVDIPNGNYYVCATAYVGSDNHAFFTGVGLSTGNAGGLDEELGLYMHFELNTGNAFVLDTSSWHSGDYNHMTVILTPIDTGGGSPTECPTLTQYIEDYTGTWSQFRNAYINPDVNNDLYWGWKNERDEVFATGKLSVTGDFINFNGTYDELLQLLMTTSNNNPNIQAALEQELQRQFENGVAGGYDDGYSDGKDYGQEIGYKEGQQDGYNKGASDSLVQNFFGNFLQGIVQAIDAIHFYEIIDDNGTPDVKDDVVEFYISPWSILVIFIGLALVLIFLKVFRGG